MKPAFTLSSMLLSSVTLHCLSPQYHSSRCMSWCAAANGHCCGHRILLCIHWHKQNQSLFHHYCWYPSSFLSDSSCCLAADCHLVGAMTEPCIHTQELCLLATVASNKLLLAKCCLPQGCTSIGIQKTPAGQTLLATGL